MSQPMPKLSGIYHCRSCDRKWHGSHVLRVGTTAYCPICGSRLIHTCLTGGELDIVPDKESEL